MDSLAQELPPGVSKEILREAPEENLERLAIQ